MGLSLIYSCAVLTLVGLLFQNISWAKIMESTFLRPLYVALGHAIDITTAQVTWLIDISMSELNDRTEHVSIDGNWVSIAMEKRLLRNDSPSVPALEVARLSPKR